jgi:hypothetical protein
MVAGTKSAVVATASHGECKLYADESAEVYFFDRGGGQLANGVAVIALDPVWLETVTIDAGHPMRVQVTLTGDCNGVRLRGREDRGRPFDRLRASFFHRARAARRRVERDLRLGGGGEAEGV